MDEVEARAILGISPTATIKDARKAHRDRAKIFHPDRHSSGTAEDLARANATMARINLALDTLIQLDASGLLGSAQTSRSSSTTSTGAFQFTPRSATVGECYMCGSTPAKPATFRGWVGILIWLSSHTFSGSFCKSCARALFRESQATNLTRGWWGIVVFPMIWSLVANSISWVSFRRLGDPSFRDISVVTPMEMPADEVRAVFARPSVWIATVVAAVILIGLGSTGSTTNGRSSSTSQGGATIDLPQVDSQALADQLRQIAEAKAFSVGGCWTGKDASGMVVPTDCDSPLARFVVAAVVLSDSECPSNTEGSIASNDGRYVCLTRLG